MLASLPMYDLPEIREATDAFWAALAKAYGVEGGLTREADYTAPWRNPDLLFSQTCGYPFTHEFAGVFKYVATPHYDADGCEGPYYRSIVFAREAAPLESFRGKVAAYNNRDSMSGMLALKLVFAPFATGGRLFASAIETGGHVASLTAVQRGDADVAAIDCVTAGYLRKSRPTALAGLREVSRSPLVPGLPYVTRSGDVERLRKIVCGHIRDLAGTKSFGKLAISGSSVLDATTYDIILRIENLLRTSGGIELW